MQLTLLYIAIVSKEIKLHCYFGYKSKVDCVKLKKKKKSKVGCYFVMNRKHGSGPLICKEGHDVELPYYHPLESCIGGTRSHRWIPIEERSTWPSRASLTSKELSVHGINFI